MQRPAGNGASLCAGPGFSAAYQGASESAGAASHAVHVSIDQGRFVALIEVGQGEDNASQQRHPPGKTGPETVK